MLHHQTILTYRHVMPHFLLKVVLTTVMTVMMTACATTHLSPQQCTQIDWQKQGYEDGLLGRGESYRQQYTNHCGSVAPNFVLWQQGYTQGLAQYCTPLRAYQLGREGYRYQNVCPAEQMLELMKYNDEGLYHYQREQNLRWWYEDDFFPFGWDNQGRYGMSRLHTPFPKRLPNYISEK